ncbi:MAG: phenylalanine--tRNA ligase subunit beta [Bacteroidales bacterium]
MKISYNWLKDYIDTRLTPEEMAKILTNTGLEVEGMEQYQPIEGGLEGLIIGKVTSCKKHPNADKLSLTTVDIGENKELPIVCGAPNVAEGQKVVVATVGTTLKMNGKDFPIKKTKIRGEISEGMICAEDEIGMGDSHEAIIVLDNDAPIGKPVKAYFNIEDDTVLEIDLTPNRIDGASHIGTARDLVAYLKQSQNIELQKPSIEDFKQDNSKLHIPVEINNKEACPRYSGVTITGIEVKPSPDWLQNRLKAIGIQPKNNLVDISNYVLHETGHPLHFFDADEIQGKKIIVKTLQDGTPFKTLDEDEIKLSSEDLMICDTENPLCIAGIFGGVKSGVSDSTKNLFIESAYFNPAWIRKTAKRHGFNTDASYRFERGADPHNTLYALKRAALLVKEIAGGDISSEIIDAYPDPIENARVKLTYEKLYNLTGQNIDKEKIQKILDSLDIETEEETDEYLLLKIPTYRVDVQRDVDVIEEILRIYGYNKIEITEKLNTSITYSSEEDKDLYTDTISTVLTGMGFNEIMANSITNDDYYKNLKYHPQDKLIYLHNPLSNDLNCMRQTLLFGGLESISYNYNHQKPDLKLFEFGNCYKLTNKLEKQPTSETILKNYIEDSHLSLFVTGNIVPEHWMTNSKIMEPSFFHLKGYVDTILEKSGFNLNNIHSEESGNDIFAQALRYKMKKHPLAEFGMIDKAILKKFDIESDVYYADIHWNTITKLSKQHSISYQEISKYPEVRRDLALLLDDSVEFEKIRELAYQAERKYLKKVNLFDVYKGEKLGAGKKSYAVSFILQDEKQTLKDKQIDKIMNKLMNTYKEKLKAEIR